MLKQRIITGLIVALLALLVLYYLPVEFFSICVALIIMVGAWEWANLASIENNSLRVAYAAATGCLCWLLSMYSISSLVIISVGILWWISAFFLIRSYPVSGRWFSSKTVSLLMGFITLIPAWSAIVLLQSRGDVLAIILLLFLVWAADVGAYFTGKCLGSHKLAEHVSPSKTIEGVLGGVVFSVAVAVAVGLFCDFSFAKGLGLLLLTVMVALVSVVGDLLESLLKRERGVKDSSFLLPGHGGVLDRIDSLTAALPVYALALFVFGS